MKSSKAFLPLNSADHLSAQELIPSLKLKHLFAQSQQFLYQQVWENWIVLFLTRSGEPQVWKKRDRQGNIFYKVYDPHTQTSADLESEQAVRIWLESRYSR